MKIVAIVGIRKSGKTATVEALCREFRRRGIRTGTCKTVFCPTFSIDKKGSNTSRHHDAGSLLVTSRAKHETAVLYPEALPLSKVLEAYSGFDVVLLEGDYDAPVARIVTAHNEKDAIPRTNELTLAYAGRIANSNTAFNGLPCFNALENVSGLADFLLEKLEDVELSPALDEKLPLVPGVSDDGFCQCGCHHHEHKAAAEEASASAQTAVIVDGKPIPLTDAMIAQIRAWAQNPEV